MLFIFYSARYQSVTGASHGLVTSRLNSYFYFTIELPQTQVSKVAE